MDKSLLNIKFKKKQIINVEGGDVYKIMKKSDFADFKFNEVYFSSINDNYVKGWKLQEKITSNICVPIGEVKFTFVSSDFKFSESYIIGEKNYGLLSFPPNIWYCFKGLSKKKSLILNLIDYEHNEKDVKKISLNNFPINIKI